MQRQNLSCYKPDTVDPSHFPPKKITILSFCIFFLQNAYCLSDKYSILIGKFHMGYKSQTYVEHYYKNISTVRYPKFAEEITRFLETFLPR
jgi:hypothetical protein